MINDYGMSLDVSKDIESGNRINDPVDNAGSKKKQETKKKPARIQTGSFNWQIAVFIAILIFVAVFTRLETVDMPLFDARAEAVVDNNIKNIITQQVALDKSILAHEKPQIAEEQYTKAINNPQRDELIKNTAASYKEAYRDEFGLNYLYGADAYHYYRQIKAIAEHDQKSSLGLPSIYAGFFKIIYFFNHNIQLKKAIFYLPVFFGTLAVIFLFFITRKITNNISGFFAGLFFALNPSFLLNTRAGFIDTNSLNVLLSLAIIYLFLHTIELKKKSIFTGVLLIMSVWIFKQIWGGYFYILFILAGCVLTFTFLYILIKAVKTREIKWKLILASIIFAGSGFIYWFVDSRYMNHILSRFKFNNGFFPSGFLTVSELQGYSFSLFSSRLGGYIIVFFVLCTIAFLTYKIFKNLTSMKDVNFKDFSDKIRNNLFIVLYFISLAFVPFFAKRFTTYFVLIFCITLGVGLYYFVPWLIRLIGYLNLNINKSYIKAGLVILISIILVMFIVPALKVNMNTIPHMNDAIYNTAIEIKYNSSENAKINLWWDYGYLYQAVAERSVSFHGGSFESSRLHWITKAFLTDDENLSAGILRMLNCNNEAAAHKILSKEAGNSKAIEILHKILAMTRQEAESYLKDNNLPEKVAGLTHCESPESFIVLGDELTNKVSVLNYYANFDFKKNSDQLEIKDMSPEDAINHLINKYNLSKKEAQKYSFELSEYDPNFMPSVQFKSQTERCQEKDGIIICGNGFIANLSSMDIALKNMHPPAFIFYNGTVYRTDYENSKIKYIPVIIEEKGYYSIFVMNPEFDRSMLFRLLYLDGKGLDNFEFFSKETMPQKVVAYRVLV